MTWIAPEPPAFERWLVADERPTLEGFLTAYRYTLLNICAGLTAEQLAERAVPPSNLSLLGIVRHMAKVERVWFREYLVQQPMEPMYGPDKQDADFEELDPARAEEDFARFAEECRLADEVAAGLPLTQSFPRRGKDYTLRFIYVHMIEEYARHCGHADLLRERIDGVKGR